MNRNLLFVLFLLLFGGYPVFGQCTGNVYFRDSDGDGFGSNIQDADDLIRVEEDFRNSGGQTGYSGNIAFGCFKPPGYADKAFDCDDNDSNVQSFG